MKSIEGASLKDAGKKCFGINLIEKANLGKVHIRQNDGG